MLANHANGANAVSDAEFRRLVHVHLGYPFPTLFEDSVLQHKGRDTPFLQPLGDVSRFEIDRERNEGAPRRYDHSSSGGLRFFRQIGG